MNKISKTAERWLLPFLIVLAAGLIVGAIVTVWPPYPPAEAQFE